MSDTPSRFQFRVYYEDTDASGVAYHANYLRWFERARTEWLRSLRVGQERLRLELGVAFTVADLSIEFRRPARLDDALEVVTVIGQLRRASIEFQQVLTRPADGQRLAQARVRVGCVNAESFRPQAIPAELAELMHRQTDSDSGTCVQAL